MLIEQKNIKTFFSSYDINFISKEGTPLWYIKSCTYNKIIGQIKKLLNYCLRQIHRGKKVKRKKKKHWKLCHFMRYRVSQTTFLFPIKSPLKCAVSKYMYAVIFLAIGTFLCFYGTKEIFWDTLPEKRRRSAPLQKLIALDLLIYNNFEIVSLTQFWYRHQKISAKYRDVWPGA